MLGLWYQEAVRVSPCRCIQARNLLQSSLPWPHGQQALDATIGRWSLAGCGLPSYTNRCSLYKDAHLSLVNIHSFIWTVRTDSSSTVDSPTAPESWFLLYASWNCRLPLRIHSSLTLTRLGCLHYLTTQAWFRILSTSFASFHHSRSTIHFAEILYVTASC